MKRLTEDELIDMLRDVSMSRPPAQDILPDHPE
jgi:hypothetical protein